MNKIKDTGVRDEIIRQVENNHVSLAEADKLASALDNRSKRDEYAKSASKIKPTPLPKGSILDSFIHADVLEGINLLEDDLVTLTVTSPPYPLKDVKYLNWVYDGDYPKYLAFMEKVFAAVYAKTKDGDAARSI